MRKLVIGSVFLLSACGGGGGGTDHVRDQLDPPQDLYGDVDVASFTMLLNNERSRAGVDAVATDDRLSTGSEAHATDMLQNDYRSHTGLDGSTPGDRARAAGYDWDFIAENIGWGQQTEEEVISDWDASPPHKEVMEHPAAEDFGIGRAGDVWVLMLGSER